MSPIIFSLICLLLIAPFEVSLAQEDGAFLVFLKGDVKVTNLKQKIYVPKMKSALMAGEILVTGPDSVAVLRMSDGSSMKVEENSEIKIDALISSKNDSATGSSRFVLKAGGVMVNVIKKYVDRPSLEVASEKGLSFGVRGTTFSVLKDDDSEDIWAVVKEGSLWAIKAGVDDTEIIESGKSMVAYKGSDLTLPLNYQWANKIDWNSMDANVLRKNDLANLRKKELKQELVRIIKRVRRTAKQAQYQRPPTSGESANIYMGPDNSRSENTQIEWIIETETIPETPNGALNNTIQQGEAKATNPNAAATLSINAPATIQSAATEAVPSAETVDGVTLTPADNQAKTAPPPPGGPGTGAGTGSGSGSGTGSGSGNSGGAGPPPTGGTGSGSGGVQQQQQQQGQGQKIVPMTFDSNVDIDFGQSPAHIEAQTICNTTNQHVKDCRVATPPDKCSDGEIELGSAEDASGIYYACAKLK